MAFIPFLLILIPLLGGVAVLVWPGDNPDKVKKISLGVALATLAIAVLMMGLFDYSKSNFLQMELSILQMSLLCVDGLTLVFVLLTAVLMPLGMLASWPGIQKSINRYYGLFLILEALIIGSFLATRLLAFYIFFEAVLVPMFFLIGIWGGKERVAASFKFFLYTMAGSVLLMVVQTLYFHKTANHRQRLTPIQQQLLPPI
jgi:NADH-quinone oxidoreductase subunit M